MGVRLRGRPGGAAAAGRRRVTGSRSADSGGARPNLNPFYNVTGQLEGPQTRMKRSRANGELELELGNSSQLSSGPSRPDFGGA